MPINPDMVCKCGSVLSAVTFTCILGDKCPEYKRERRNKARREREQAMRDLGLKKVRGGLGGVYWE